MFTEQWYSTSDIAALRDAVLDARGVTGKCCEIGSWEGRSAMVIAPILAPRKLYCVDIWENAQGWKHPRAAEAHAAFLRNTHGIANITGVHSDWSVWVERVKGKFAFVHIDANHDYDTVRDQIAAFAPRMAKGGVLCGHDYQPGTWDGVVEAVDEFLPQREVTACVWRATVS